VFAGAARDLHQARVHDFLGRRGGDNLHDGVDQFGERFFCLLVAAALPQRFPLGF
jgi:hypothetical protein